MACFFLYVCVWCVLFLLVAVFSSVQIFALLEECRTMATAMAPVEWKAPRCCHPERSGRTRGGGTLYLFVPLPYLFVFSVVPFDVSVAPSDNCGGTLFCSGALVHKTKEPMTESRLCENTFTFIFVANEEGRLFFLSFFFSSSRSDLRLVRCRLFGYMFRLPNKIATSENGIWISGRLSGRLIGSGLDPESGDPGHDAGLRS